MKVAPGWLIQQGQQRGSEVLHLLLRLGTDLGRLRSAEGTQVCDIGRKPLILSVLLRTSDRTKTGEYLRMRRRPAMFKFALTFLERLPPFRPASIEHEMEQTLCLVRRCRQEREKADARRR